MMPAALPRDPEAELRLLQEAQRRALRRPETALERLTERVIKVLGGNLPPSYPTDDNDP